MNELLQQRIQAVQIGRNTTFAQMEQKKSLRDQLDSQLEAFLSNGGVIEQLPQGFSGEYNKGWNNSKPKAQKTMREVMASAVSEAHKKRARQKEDQTPIADIKALSEWCKARKGRSGELCKHIGVAHGFISQITNQVRPCSKDRYEQIKLAVKTIEQREQVTACKKRNKKYNPNKLVNLYRNELAKTYELWSSFDDVELTEASNELRANGVSKKQAIEGMYEYFDGDLVVPILWDLMVDDTAFFVGMDSYYYHKDDPADIQTSAVQFDVPAMTYDQFKLGGSDAKVTDEHGFKRRWKGLEQETDDVHKPFLDKGYKLFKCMCYMKADVKFKDFESYSKFKAERVSRGMRRKYRLQELAA